MGHESSHILCVHLPGWPITRWFRRRRDPEQQRIAVVVVGTVRRRRIVLAASDAAQSRGVRPGLSLTEARALCPSLTCIEHDPANDRRALVGLGRWMTRFTPIVAIGWGDKDENGADDDDAAVADVNAPHVLFLDLTGCERFFGGVHVIVRRVRQALAHFNVPASLAVAPTVGAAWAFALDGQNGDVRIVGERELPDALGALPVYSLRLNDEIVAALHHLGLRTISQLLAIPRAQFPSRFGLTLLLRLDQALGNRRELLKPLLHDVPVQARVEFEAPIDALETIWLAVQCLIERIIVPDLTHRGHGARRIDLICTPGHGARLREPIVKTIELSSPTRSPKVLCRLLRCVTEQLSIPDGIARIDLKVPAHEPAVEQQIHLLDGETIARRWELDRLIEQLRVRLGSPAVVWPELMESYLPERAWRPISATKIVDASHADADRPSPPPRPIDLLPTPIEVRVISEPSDDREGNPSQFTWGHQVHRLVHATGPERIAGEWWRGHPRTRDYYDVEDADGRRFWLFRVMRQIEDRLSVRWYVHGRFA